MFTNPYSKKTFMMKDEGAITKSGVSTVKGETRVCDLGEPMPQFIITLSSEYDYKENKQ